MTFPDPPSHVQAAEATVPVLITLAQTGFATYLNTERRNLERAIELGKTLIQLKSKCKHGEWLPTLQKVGISPFRAAEFVRLAKFAAAANLNCDSIREALQDIKDIKAEEEIPPPGQQSDAFLFEIKPTQPIAEPTKTPPTPRELHCFACKHAARTGQTVPKSCKGCKEIIREAAQGWEGMSGRAKKPPKGGFSPASVGAHLNGIMRHVGNMAVDLGVEVNPADEPERMRLIRAKLHEAKREVLKWWKELKEAKKAAQATSESPSAPEPTTCPLPSDSASSSNGLCETGSSNASELNPQTPNS